MALVFSLNTSAATSTASISPAIAGSRFSSFHTRRNLNWGAVSSPLKNRIARRIVVSGGPPSAGSRADDSSASFEMSMENALKLLGVSEGASFEDILRAKKSILASSKEDQEFVDKVEAAYEILLMQSLAQRRAGKVLNSNVRYADVKRVKTVQESNPMPQWMQSTVKNVSVSVESPSTSSLGIETGVFGSLIALTYVTGTATFPTGSNNGADVPGLILATAFGASLYFLAKKNVKLGKAALMTTGALVVGAVIGSTVENWLQVDIVPFFGIRSPAVVVSEFVLVSQLLVSLYLR